MIVLETYCVVCGSKQVSCEEHKKGFLHTCLNPRCEKEWWIPKNENEKSIQTVPISKRKS